MKCEAIGSMGKFVGLWIIWYLMKIEVDMIQFPSNRFLSLKITCNSSNVCFAISNIYAPNSIASRRNVWNFLSNHRNSFQNLPWLIGGDFNTPLNVK